jgi:hypothetical protein
VRAATAEKAVIFEKAAKVAKPPDDVLLAYLIELDCEHWPRSTGGAGEPFD